MPWTSGPWWSSVAAASTVGTWWMICCVMPTPRSWWCLPGQRRPLWFRTVAGTGRVRDVPGDAPWGGVAAVGEILAGRLVRPGLVPLDTWMPAERLWPALTSRGVNLWRRENGGWQLLHADTDVMARAAARPVVDGDWQHATISSSHSTRFGTFPHTGFTRDRAIRRDLAEECVGAVEQPGYATATRYRGRTTR